MDQSYHIYHNFATWRHWWETKTAWALEVVSSWEELHK